MKTTNPKPGKKSYVELGHLTDRIKYPRAVFDLILEPKPALDGPLMSIDTVNEVRAVLAIVVLTNLHTIRAGQPVHSLETFKSEFLRCAGLPNNQHGARGSRIIQALRNLSDKKIIGLTEVGRKLVIRIGSGFDLDKKYIYLPPDFIGRAKSKLAPNTFIPGCFEKFLVFLTLYGHDRLAAMQVEWDGSINEINYKNLAKKIGIGHLVTHRKSLEMQGLIEICAQLGKDAGIVTNWSTNTCKTGNDYKIKFKLRPEYFARKKVGLKPAPAQIPAKHTQSSTPQSSTILHQPKAPSRKSPSIGDPNYFKQHLLPQLRSALSGEKHNSSRLKPTSNPEALTKVSENSVEVAKREAEVSVLTLMEQEHFQYSIRDYEPLETDQLPSYLDEVPQSEYSPFSAADEIEKLASLGEQISLESPAVPLELIDELPSAYFDNL